MSHMPLRKLYKTGVGPDGQYEVIESISGQPDVVLSRHFTVTDAKQWMGAHLAIIAMDDLTTVSAARR
jgi:hypothetical protein